MTRHLTCQNWRCKAEFIAARGMGAPPKFCSDECRVEATKERKRIWWVGHGRRPLPPRRPCPDCGKEHACNALAHRIGGTP